MQMDLPTPPLLDICLNKHEMRVILTKRTYRLLLFPSRANGNAPPLDKQALRKAYDPTLQRLWADWGVNEVDGQWFLIEVSACHTLDL